jgi:type IV pilus assembly protein PilC
MEKFQYSAFDEHGVKVTGTESATSSGAVHLALLERGYQPLEVTQKSSIMQFEITKKKVHRKDIMHFSRQLAVFVKAGIPIMEALEVIGDETTDKLLKAALADMIDQLQSGDTFAAAAAAHPEAFPNYYVGILHSAELTGTLDLVLNQLADYLERDIDARGKITAALVYPAVVMGMSIVTIVVLASFVMPRFKTFFASFHAKLPLPTRMLLAVSNFFSTYWYFILGAIVLFVVAIIVIRRSQSMKIHLDSLILKLPVMGDLVQAAVLERICRILSSMIKAGVALPEAMAVTADSANNMVYKEGILTIREEMMEGQGLSGAATQMFRVGEETGTLDQQLETAAIFYNRELDVKIKRFTSLFEPAVIIFMGVVVGFVAVALVTAMYGIYNQVKVQ